MSLVKCRTPGCPHQVREGLRRPRLVKGGDGQDLADGETCWRCRAKEGRERKRDRRELEAPKRQASWNGDTWMCSCQFVNDARRKQCRKCKEKAPHREVVRIKCFSKPRNKIHFASKGTLSPICGAKNRFFYSEVEDPVSCKDCKRLTS